MNDVLSVTDINLYIKKLYDLAKKNVYLFTPRKKVSIFVKELLKKYKNFGGHYGK